MLLIILAVVGTILIGISIYGVIVAVRKLKHPAERISDKEKQETELENYGKVNQDTQMVTNNSHFQTQYDPNKDFAAVFDTGAKLKQEEELEKQQENDLAKKMHSRESQNQMIQLKKKMAQRKENKILQTNQSDSVMSNPDDLNKDRDVELPPINPNMLRSQFNTNLDSESSLNSANPQGPNKEE